MNHYARVCKQISKPRGNRNVNKISDSDNEEEYNEENYSEEDSDEYTFRLTHTVRAVKDKGTQWFLTLKMKANDHSRDVKCQIDTVCSNFNSRSVYNCFKVLAEMKLNKLCRLPSALRKFSALFERAIALVHQ